MIHLLPDDFMGRERLAAIRLACGEPDMVAMNTSQLDGARLDFGELTRVAGALPFLADKRLVIVRGFLAQTESKDGEAGDGGEKKKGTRAERLRVLVEWLPDLPPTTELVFLEAPNNKGLPGASAILKAGGEVLQSRPLDPAQTADFATKRARAKGGAIHPDAAAYLGLLVNGDLQRLDTELDKLLTYRFDGDAKVEITLADVKELVGDGREEIIFALVDAIGMRERRRALAILRSLLQSGSAAPYVLTMIVRQFRLLVQTHELLSEHADQGRIAAELHISPWQAGKLAGQARRFKMSELESAYQRLFETDRASKTGVMDAEAAIDLLVAELVG